MNNLQCNCSQWWRWFIAPFGANSFQVLCATCGKNVTTAAENILGISPKHDDFEMAKNHLDLAKYEHLPASKGEGE